jgi:hypothetical protein
MQPSSRLANIVPSWLQDLFCSLLFWAALVAAILFTAAAVECSLLNDQAVELCSESFTAYPEFGSLTLYLCLGICSPPPPSSIGEISPAFSTNREEGFTTGSFLPIHAGVNIVCCLCLLWMCSRFVVNPFRHLRWVVSDPAVRLYEMAMWTNTLFMLGYLWGNPRRRGGSICAHCIAHGQRDAHQRMHVLPGPCRLAQRRPRGAHPAARARQQQQVLGRRRGGSRQRRRGGG